MRIALITQDSSRISPWLIEKYEIAGVVEPSAKQKNSKVLSCLIRVIRKARNFKRPLQELSFKQKIPYLYLKEKNTKKLNDFIMLVKPDLVLVYSMPYLIDTSTLKLVSLGFINIHPSYLPKYRGPKPGFWQYFFNDDKHGYTIHYIDEKEDNGDIIFQEEIVIAKGTSAPDRLDILIKESCVRAMPRVLDSIERGVVESRKQTNTNASFRARRVKRKEHEALIEWDKWSTERVWHFLRGTESWFFPLKAPSKIFKSMRWKVLGYDKVLHKGLELGTVIKDNDDYRLVCSDGFIDLKKTLSIRAEVLYWLNKLP